MSTTGRSRRYWIWTLAAVVWATASVLIAKAPQANTALSPDHKRLTAPGRAFKINRPEVE